MSVVDEVSAGSARNEVVSSSAGTRVPVAVWRNLLAGTRLATFLPVDLRGIRVSVLQMVLLAVVGIVVVGTQDYVDSAPGHYFSENGVTYLATGYLLLLLSVFSIAGVQREPGSASTVLLLVLAADPLFALADFTLSYAIEQGYEAISSWTYYLLSWGCWLAWVIWKLAFVGRVVSVVFRPRARRLMALVAIFAIFNVAPTLVIGRDVLFYDYQSIEEETSSEAVDVEGVYYSQPALVARAVGSLESGRPGEPDLYFIGFAPYAEQDVFMKEVEFVRGLFDARFDTRGRSLNLINNAQTVDTVALANTTNLRTVLHATAERMDLDEDILFLFITSHGSSDGVLSVSFWPLEPNDLSAAELAGMLDESGIKWRVLVISACYSGSFIETLENEHTLILTAASKDRTSFGCSNDRDFTYFGEHFFLNELSKESSFAKAFEKAREAIDARERREGQDPSQPQMRMGAEMAGKLATFEGRLGR